MYLATLKPAMFKMNIKYKIFNHVKECDTYFNIQTISLLQLTFFFRLLQYKEVETYLFQLTLDFFQN